jgi:hypothetical protein
MKDGESVFEAVSRWISEMFDMGAIADLDRWASDWDLLGAITTGERESLQELIKVRIRELQLREGSYVGFNTGGYTGAWGSEGRLAMLHEKELVLNQDDTKNLLETVDVV